MVATSTPAYAQTPKNTVVQILAADTQTFKTAYTGGTNGSVVCGLFVTSTDTSNRDITINLTISATNYQLSQISIPLTAGTINSVVPVNILGHANMAGLPKDSNGNPFIFVASGTTLTVNAPVTLTAAKLFTILAIAEDL